MTMLPLANSVLVPPGSRIRNLMFQSGWTSLAMDSVKPSRAHLLYAVNTTRQRVGNDRTYDAWYRAPPGYPARPPMLLTCTTIPPILPLFGFTSLKILTASLVKCKALQKFV